ncbi:hypothetical protein MycrhN_5426 [Mycolicibacterium rhodesiae NBB3]|uniref:Uncharacterized protein n=1 Tax=Mycolicibacterium rhodesiae (strain NBB3) TaxID=710685 RepID=G8RIJ3_MYCRN|nr:hypothetical protein MycrhN_5426 [Mycolicibacterium rhodesiae NBB3]
MLEDEAIAWQPQSHLTFRLNATSVDTALLAKLVAKHLMNSKYRQYLSKLRKCTAMRVDVSI